MNISIEEIRQKDERLLEVVSSSVPTIKDGIPKDWKYSQTWSVLFEFCNRMGFLKTGILDLAETNNLYGMNVLFRVFLEHMLKANIVHLRALHEGNDTPASEYLDLQMVELLHLCKSHRDAGLDIGQSL